MLRLLADGNFNGDVVDGLLLRQPNLELLRVQDVGLSRANDPEILAWAAAHDRIVLTHDRATMTRYGYMRVAAGDPMPGIFIFDHELGVGRMIDEILLINECSEQPEWSSRAVHLPL